MKKDGERGGCGGSDRDRGREKKRNRGRERDGRDGAREGDPALARAFHTSVRYVERITIPSRSSKKILTRERRGWCDKKRKSAHALPS
jgi:hypothetical protein